MDGRVVVFPLDQLQWVNVYDPLRGVPVAELKVRKSYATGKHICGELVRVYTSGLKGVGLSLRFHEFVFDLSSSFPLFHSPCRLRER